MATKVDLATKLLRTTSVSCSGEPQVRFISRII